LIYQSPLGDPAVLCGYDPPSPSRRNCQGTWTSVEARRRWRSCLQVKHSRRQIQVDGVRLRQQRERRSDQNGGADGRNTQTKAHSYCTLFCNVKPLRTIRVVIAASEKLAQNRVISVQCLKGAYEAESEETEGQGDVPTAS
jgi:hypothetical protein